MFYSSLIQMLTSPVDITQVVHYFITDNKRLFTFEPCIYAHFIKCLSAVVNYLRHTETSIFFHYFLTPLYVSISIFMIGAINEPEHSDYYSCAKKTFS